ncbi:hypothetical protein KIW84_063159 [Lathyrus oleraceus]|uniref:Cation efflux protein cytoplasmic domain-containing protein n=1 Tax=Pisum sativum TaxID=3888 RepID=A0A9D4W8Q8_PEA|nr:hypothetical protein KIW84_063159 [Pisum sativum]
MMAQGLIGFKFCVVLWTSWYIRYHNVVLNQGKVDFNVVLEYVYWEHLHAAEEEIVKKLKILAKRFVKIRNARESFTSHKEICGALLAWQLRDSSELEEFDETLVHFIYSASIGLNHEGEKRFSLLEKTASIFRPKLIIVGASAHPRDIDYPRFRKIAVTASVVDKQKELLANYFDDWMDPVGAIILPLYTIRTWSMTVLENVNSLVGRSAAPEYLQKLTYLCWNHHKAVRHIDNVRAYTFGSHYFVEVDIVLPAGMPLQEAHDIGESLQEKLELLPEIERAFVHLDYEYSHKPEHAQAHS